MKKFLLSLVSLLLTTLMFAAEPIKTLTFPDYNDQKVGSYTMERTATVDGETWTLSGFNNNNNGWAYVRCGQKAAENTASITTPAFAEVVTSIVYTIDKTSHVTSATFEVLNGTKVVSSQDVLESVTAGDMTVEVADGKSGYSYKLTLVSEVAGSNGTTQLSKVAVYGEAAAPASFKITSSTPADGSAVAGIAKGDYVKFATNMDDVVKGVTYTYIDATAGKNLYTTFSTSYSADEQCWSIKNFSTAVSDFVKGHVIKFAVDAYDEARPSSNLIGSDTIYWVGDGSEEYQYSPVEVLSVTPAAGSIINSTTENEFVITYSAPVEIDQKQSCVILGQMSSTTYESITSNDDKTVWTLKVSEDILATITPQLYLNVYVKDANGLVLRGNVGEDLKDASYYKYKYKCYIGSPDLTITPAGGPVASLKDFTLSYEGGIARSYTNNTPLQILAADGSEVASVNLDKLANDGDNTLVFSLDEAITAEGTYTLSIPAEIFSLGTEFDGYTSKAQTVSYTIGGEALTLTSVYPAEGAALDMMPNISATFSNTEAVGYANYVITDQTLADTDPDMAIVMSGDLKKQADGSWTTKWLASYEIKLYEGHNYVLSIKAYETEDDANYGNSPLAVFNTNFTGTSKAYQYADVELVSINPEPYTTIVSGDIMATFSAPVETLEAVVNDGLMGDTPCTATPNEDKTVWIVTIPESKLLASTGSLNVMAYAKDAEGRVVKGNSGEEEASCFEWTYNCYLGAPDFAVTPAEGVVEKLDVLTASYEGGINFSYNTSAKIQVVRMQELICEVPNENVTFNTDYTQATITLPKEITAAGTYQVIFPALYFILGEEFNSVMSKQQVFEYTIEGDDPQDPPVVEKPAIDPAEGVVASLKKFMLTFAQGSCVGSDGSVQAYLTDAEGNTVATAQADYDWDIWEIGYLTLNEEITEPGTYTLVVPEGVFALDEMGTKFNPSVTYAYTIEAAEPTAKLEVLPAEGTVTSLQDFVFTFGGEGITPSYQEGLDLTITNDLGEVVAIIAQDDIKTGTAEDFNELYMPIRLYASILAPITKSGIYTLNVPAGAFYVGENMDNNEAATFTYQVEGKPETDPADGSTVESLKKIKITFAADACVGTDGSVQAYVTDEEGNTVATSQAEYDWDVWNVGYIILDKEITEPGTYTLVIPEGVFALDMDGTKFNPELTYTFIIPVPTGITSHSATTALRDGKYIEGHTIIIVKNGVKYNLNGVIYRK